MLMLPLYLLFMASGATALVYQVVWVRQQSLVFGGSHLAVSTVLAVFMGGLALGGWFIGRRADRWSRPLRAYGLLELGIAASALLVHAALKAYPALYPALARPFADNAAVLTVIRFAFAAAAMILPTTLMGATLPVLARHARSSGPAAAGHLSKLYGINTLGAVAGAMLAGFLMLPRLGATTTMLFAFGLNVLVGVAAVMLGGRDRTTAEGPTDDDARPADLASARSARLVLAGIGVSGFCALGYEVLWTRALGTTIGTSTYAFTVMLAAFLTGIGLGSEIFGLTMRRAHAGVTGSRLVGAFAAIQGAIGLSAVVVTWLLGDLAGRSSWLQSTLVGAVVSEFTARQSASFGAAFGYLVLPALLMGAAFPLAATVQAARSRRLSGSVGEVMAWNTAGAILGALVSGFLLIRLLGIERSLMVLASLNVAIGLAVAASLTERTPRRRLGLAAALAIVAIPFLLPANARLWNPELMAIYRNNQRTAFDTEQEVAVALANTSILHFHEGVNSTISVIKVAGGDQAVLVNGKVVASTMGEDVQCQYLLGHLPMLLHRDPRNVFVLGLGTGMTLGAVALHPEAERIVLAELEPEVVPAARTFAPWNHEVLDDPRLEIAFNDGRNWLLTTQEQFEVITADPVHPWTRGSAYLYTAEYYRLAASRLKPGGVMMQWLPLYELAPADVATVVRTFRTAFPHTQVWLTHYDAHLVGSDRPLEFDLQQLERRLAQPRIRDALARADMASLDDFLDFFHFGDAGAAAYAELGTINTDDNLFLEFSAPRSTGVATRIAENVETLSRFREPAPWRGAVRRLGTGDEVAIDRTYDRMHALFLRGQHREPEFAALADRLRRQEPDFAPLRLLDRVVARDLASIPRPVATARLAVPGAPPGQALEIAAVTMRTGTGRAALLFVDNAAREIYGEGYLDAEESVLDARIATVAGTILSALQSEAAALADSAVGALDGRELLGHRARSLIADHLHAAGALVPGAVAQPPR